MLTGFLCCVRRTFKIARVIKRIKDAEYTDAVIGSSFHKRIDDIIGIVPVTQ